jgi:hypothetical protein
MSFHWGFDETIFQTRTSKDAFDFAAMFEWTIIVRECVPTCSKGAIAMVLKRLCCTDHIIETFYKKLTKSTCTEKNRQDLCRTFFSNLNLDLLEKVDRPDMDSKICLLSSMNEYEYYWRGRRVLSVTVHDMRARNILQVKRGKTDVVETYHNMGHLLKYRSGFDGIPYGPQYLGGHPTYLLCGNACTRDEFFYYLRNVSLLLDQYFDRNTKTIVQDYLKTEIELFSDRRSRSAND